MTAMIDFTSYRQKIEKTNPCQLLGRILHINGMLMESSGPPGAIGDLCTIIDPQTKEPHLAEIIGFKQNKYYLMTYGGEMTGIAPGTPVYSTGESLQIPVGESLKGRIINGLGQPIDGKGDILPEKYLSLLRPAPDALKRKRIDTPFHVGIRAIDGCLPIGLGQRVGIFSGSGVGKSTLLGMMARGSDAEINVICLLGERGREVREFIEKDLGEEGMKKSVVIVVTSDQPALMKIKGAYVATTIAEYFRDKGKLVLFTMDSLTRFAMAQREVGLSLGEPPTTKGYTPSVFAMLPKLLERTGMGENGAITAFYTILVDADDFNEPISDSSRAILDGHIVLSRRIASMNHYPSIDILESVSRLADAVASEEQMSMLRKIKELMAVYEEARDLINIGAYAKGANPKIDEAISKIDAINQFLRQNMYEQTSFETVMETMKKITSK